MMCDSYMPCDGEDFSDTGQWYVVTWCLMVDWNKKYSLGFGDDKVRIERRGRWNHVAAEWESLKQCRSTRCRFGTRAPPCNLAGWTVRRSLHRLTGWIHANEPLLLNIGHTMIGLYICMLMYICLYLDNWVLNTNILNFLPKVPQQWPRLPLPLWLYRWGNTFRVVSAICKIMIFIFKIIIISIISQ